MNHIALETNPFNPGMAAPPLYLAGREEELRIIGNVLKVIATPRDEGQPLSVPLKAPIKIVGPRGVGKTTLLVEARERAEQLGICAVHVERLNTKETADKMMSSIVGDEKASKSLLKRINKLGIGGVSVGLDSLQQERILEEVMLVRLRAQPLLLVLDEVMHYDIGLFSSLMQTCQKLISYKQPLAVIMAGTPQLEQYLEQAEATFIDRSRNIYINALSDTATREALSKPFELLGAKLTKPALQYMKKLTDNYPFFIQIVGEEVWEAMLENGKQEAGLSEARQRVSEIQQRREQFYRTIYSKIIGAKQVPNTRRVMEILKMNGGTALREIVLAGLAGKKLDVYGQEQIDILNYLLDMGFVWEDNGELAPGIPSFFGYCKKRETKKKKGKV